MDNSKKTSHKIRPIRVSHRLRDFDYGRAEAYFVTICTVGMKCIFGTVNSGVVDLNCMGVIMREEWLRMPQRWPLVRLDEFAVMPNHLHGIIIFGEASAALSAGDTTAGDLSAGDLKVAPTVTLSVVRGEEWGDLRRPGGPGKNSLGTVIGQFKAGVTRRIRSEMMRPRFRVWQRDYYDHIIREDDDWDRIRAYILENPTNWHSDSYYCP